MGKFFVGLYRFFDQHKLLMYSIMVVSALVFAWFGLKLECEEDISKLVTTGGDSESSFIFENVKVKNKVFVQFMSKDPGCSLDSLFAAEDVFIEELSRRDSSRQFVSNILCSIEPTDLMDAFYFVLDHIPSFVDASCYPVFDSLMTPEAASLQMKDNVDILMNDMSGVMSGFVAQDPFAFRKALIGDISLEGGAGAGGLSLVDGRLMSKDSTVAYVLLSPSFDYSDSGSSTGLTKEIEAASALALNEYPGVDILFHGLPERSAGNSRAIKKDLMSTILVSLLLILIFMAICFKDGNTILLQLLPVAYGALFALAVIYWIKGSMSLMAIGLGAIVLGVALSYCLHLITHYKYTGDVQTMLLEESKPVFLGCLTTIGAFSGLLLTGSELLQDFGLFATLSLIGSTSFALIFLPHFFRGRTGRNEKIFKAIDNFNSVRPENHPVLIAAVAIVGLVCIAFSPKVGFDADMRKIGYLTPSAVKSEKLYQEKTSEGFKTVYYAAAGPSLDVTLERTASIASTLDSLQKEGLIDSYTKAAPTLLKTSEEQAGRIASWENYWTPEKQAYAGAQLSRAAVLEGIDPGMFAPFHAMIRARYEPASLLEAGVVPEVLMENIIEQSEDGHYMVFLPAKMKEEVADEVSTRVTATPHALVMDTMFYANTLVKAIHDDFNVALWISSIFVLIVLLLSFRNIWTSLLAFLPMFLSWYIVQGVMAIFGIPFNLINIVISTFIFGIGVDYSIFVMEGLLNEVRTGSDELLVAHKAAIFFSALILFVVTVALLLAKHPALKSSGLCTLIGMSSTIILTYTLQPFVFKKMMKSAYFKKSMVK